MKTDEATPSNAIAILVVSCDAYRDLWEPFFRCFFKYWPDCPYPVYLGANSAICPDTRVRALTIGPDVDYSSNLIAMLQRIDEQWVIFWIEDRVLAAPVNTARVANVVAMAQEQKTGFVKLIASHPYALMADKYQEFGPIPKGTPYRVCMTIGLWHRPTLLKLLCPGETAWQIERQGSQRSNLLDEAFCALSYRLRRDPPFHDMHLIIKGQLLRDAVSFLQGEGLDQMLANRPLQTLRSFLYVRAYLISKNLTSGIRYICRRLVRPQ